MGVKLSRSCSIAAVTASKLRGGFAQEVLELGEDLLDGIEVGRVFRQEEELGAGGADGVAHRSGSEFVFPLQLLAELPNAQEGQDTGDDGGMGVICHETSC